MENRYIISGILILFFINLQAFADKRDETEDLASIDKIVVTATMTEKAVKDTPGSIEVITEEAIISMNAETVSDVLEEAAGLVVTTETGRQKRPGIRGTGSKHTLVLVDGRRIASGFKELAGVEQLPVDMIKRIEVVRGPSASIYGSDAIGGVVNIITKNAPKEFSLGVSAQYGQSTYAEAEEKYGSAFMGSSSEKFGFVIAGGYRDKNGYDRDGVTPDDGDSITMKSIAGHVSYYINGDHEITAGLEFADQNTVGLRDLQNMDRERDADSTRINYFLEYNGRLSPLSNLMLRANRSEHETEINITPETSMIVGATGDENNSDRFLNQLEGRYTVALGDRHILTVGTEYREEGRKDDSGLDDDIDNLSVYLQDEYMVSDKLYLMLSGRWDDHSTFGSEFTPRVSLTYNIIDNLRFKTSWAQGFRAPDIMELFVPTYMKRGKQVYEPNENLNTEKSDSYEAGFEGEYKNFDARLMWYKNDIEDLIDAVWYRSTGNGNGKKDYYRYMNISKAVMEGVEFETGCRFENGVRISGNIAYLDTENKLTGEELEGRPDYKGTLKISHNRLPAGFSGNIRINHIGERYYADRNEEVITLVNLYLAKKLFSNVKIFAGADNLFNTGDPDDVEPAFFYSGISLEY